MFDVNSFLEQSYTEANSTQLVPIDEGEYIGVIEKYVGREWKKKDDPSVHGIALDITWAIDSPELKAKLGRDKITCRQGIMLDMDEAGQLDFGKGKNVSLGKLREATGLNVPGQPFSFSQFVGKMAKISVKNRMDPNDAEKIYSEVKAVAKLA